MEYMDISSSTIKAVAYNSDTRNLFIRFQTGASWVYEGVPSLIFDHFMKSESKGQFFAKNIKNVFPAKKLEKAEIVEAPEKGIVLSDLEKEVMVLVDRAKNMQITTKEEASEGSRFIVERKKVISAFKSWYAPLKAKAKAVWGEASAKEKSIVDPNEEAIKIVRDKIALFEDQEARRVREEAERKRKEAEEAERVRRQKEEDERRERIRIEDESRAKEAEKLKAEREKFEAEKAAQAKALEEAGAKEQADKVRRQAEAQAHLDRLLAEGERIKRENERLKEELEAKEAMEAPIYVPEPVVEEVAITGVSVAKIWKAEVVDMRAFCKGIADGRTPVECVKIDQPKLNQLAKTWKEKTGEHHPGVKGYEDKSIRTREEK